MRDLNRLNDKLDNDLELCPDGRETDPATGLDGDYFDETIENDGLSGDDVNRRLREKRLGFKAPSEDWDQAGTIIHCIFKDQIPTKSHASIILWNGVGLRAPIGFIADKSLTDIVLDYRGLPWVEHKLDGARVAFLDVCSGVHEFNSDICNTCTTKCLGCDITGNTGNCEECDENHCLTCTDGNRHQDADEPEMVDSIDPSNGTVTQIPAFDDICNKCGDHLEADGSCPNLHCSGEADEPNKAYHIESAFASVSMNYYTACKQWSRDCKPVCEDYNDLDNLCTHIDNSECECSFVKCPRVCTGF